jgi:hypothetical protein
LAVTYGLKKCVPFSVLITCPASNGGNPLRIDGFATAYHGIVEGGESDELALSKACNIVTNLLYVQGSGGEITGSI